MKTQLKNLLHIFAKSFTLRALFCIVLAFVAIMLTTGSQGQMGLAFQGLEFVYMNDPVGSEILSGNTFESEVAAGTADEELLRDFQIFFFKALFSLIAFIIWMYAVFVAAQTLIWNVLNGKISLKGFLVRSKLNAFNAIIAIGIAIVSLLIFIGLQFFQVVSAIAPFIQLIIVVGAFVIGAFMIHFFFYTNLLVLHKKKVKSIYMDFFKFDKKRMFYFIPIYLLGAILLVVFSILGQQIAFVYPTSYGLFSALSIVIPFVWMQQLLYNEYHLEHEHHAHKSKK